VIWIRYAVVAAVFEELFFRGLLYRGLAESRLGVAGAVVVTAAVFALLHWRLTAFDLSYLFASGLGFGLLRAQRFGGARHGRACAAQWPAGVVHHRRLHVDGAVTESWSPSAPLARVNVGLQ